MRSADNNWDFWTLLPEALHEVTMIMGDRGIPKSFRHMDGFSSHTYSLVSAERKRFWVKFTFKTMQKIEYLTDADAQAAIGRDRESHMRDVFESIEHGDYPRWKLFVQVMKEDEANDYHIHPFDMKKGWPHRDYPLFGSRDIGAESQPRELLRRGRTSRILACQRCSWYRVLSR